MPELPEVETTRRGIAPHVEGHQITALVVRNPNLRWPVPAEMDAQLRGQRLQTIRRRGKYLLFDTSQGSALLHLGMSGSLRIVQRQEPPMAHDHVDICFEHGRCLRLRDPRRFGALLWAGKRPETHKLLHHLGPEPLSADFDIEHLAAACAGRRQAIKTLIMDSKVVVGVGNIYASESLFLAGIHPKRAANRISRQRLALLVEAIKIVLERAIVSGGTTLRDFVDGEGQPGYFQQELNVYGRTGRPCRQCGTPIRQITLGQRSTYYCPACQR